MEKAVETVGEATETNAQRPPQPARLAITSDPGMPLLRTPRRRLLGDQPARAIYRPVQVPRN
jgi:hypothetical protein